MSDILDNKCVGKKGKDMDSTPALLRRTDEPKEKKPKDADVDLGVLGVDKKVSKEMLQSIIDARCEEIFEMAKENVTKAGYDIAMPAGIVLTGGTSLLRNITKTTQCVFGVASRVGYPSGLSGMTEEISDPSFACVQGLIKHALDDDVDIANGGEKKKTNVGGFFGKVGEWFKSLLP
jgi:cell division protein FtsA